MALKEPDMNSPQCNWGLRYTYVFSSSEGAEYFKGSIFHLVLYQPPKGVAYIRLQMSPFYDELVAI
jgi:hypothetical protein